MGSESAAVALLLAASVDANHHQLQSNRNQPLLASRGFAGDSGNARESGVLNQGRRCEEKDGGEVPGWCVTGRTRLAALRLTGGIPRPPASHPISGRFHLRTTTHISCCSKQRKDGKRSLGLHPGLIGRGMLLIARINYPLPPFSHLPSLHPIPTTHSKHFPFLPPGLSSSAPSIPAKTEHRLHPHHHSHTSCSPSTPPTPAIWGFPHHHRPHHHPRYSQSLGSSKLPKISTAADVRMP